VRYPDVLETRQVVGDAFGVVRLVAIVELLEDTARELVDEAAQADAPGVRQAALGDGGQLGDDPEVGLGLGHDPRALDLDGNHGSVMQGRAMDLCRRGRGERLVLDRREELLRRATELALDDGPRVLPWKRRGVALQLRELLDDLGRQGVAAAGDHLADLHVGRSELLEQLPERLRSRRDDVFRFAEHDPREPAPEAADRRRIERRVQGDRIDRLVDLLQPIVLEDDVAPRRWQRIEEAPQRGRRPAAGQPGAVEPEQGADDSRGQRVERPDDEEPEQLRGGDPGNVRCQERRDPQDQRVHDHEEQAHRGQQQAPGQGDDQRADEPLDEDEDRGCGEDRDNPGAAQLQDRGLARPERERLRDLDQAEQQDDHDHAGRVGNRLDHESAHRVPRLGCPLPASGQPARLARGLGLARSAA
jgi:hypothetical protein